MEPLRRLISALEVELKIRTQEMEAAAPEQLPVGLGKLTSQILEREVADSVNEIVIFQIARVVLKIPVMRPPGPIIRLICPPTCSLQRRPARPRRFHSV